MQASRRTLERRYAHVIREARSRGKMSLRRKRFEVALNGNVPMLIWLSKQILGETDVVENREFSVRANVPQADDKLMGTVDLIDHILEKRSQLRRNENALQIESPTKIPVQPEAESSEGVREPDSELQDFAGLQELPESKPDESK